MIDEIRNKKLFLFDMDGTIYKGNKLFSGTKELLQQITKMGGKYIFITNNSSKSIYDYIKKINDMGIEADYDNFYTSTQATIEFLKNKYPNKLIYCVGTEGFVNELKNNDINVTITYDKNVDVVLIGFDTELNYQKLRDVCKILFEKNNIPYIATNPDLACPLENGYIPDCGAIAKMIECATRRTPIFIGKPEPTMINYSIKKFDYLKDETVVIGDRLYTDIASGLNAEVSTICVLTGEATIEEIQKSKIKPTFVLNSVKDIYDILKRINVTMKKMFSEIHKNSEMRKN